jgi:hypothetical protein
MLQGACPPDCPPGFGNDDVNQTHSMIAISTECKDALLQGPGRQHRLKTSRHVRAGLLSKKRWTMVSRAFPVGIA